MTNDIFKCEFCGNETGPHDEQSMVDGVGVYCGECCHRMGLDSIEDLSMSCGLCRFPIMSDPYLIEEPGHEGIYYCRACYDTLQIMRFMDNDYEVL